MSYSAFVICNCFKEGKTTEPPHKEFLKFDDDGLYLDVPIEIWEKDEERTFQMESDFEEWKRTSCEHEDMELAYEHLSNESGMGAFKKIIQQLGGKNKFPVLTNYLPIANGGILPSEFSQLALNELELIEQANISEKRINLIEKSTGELLATTDLESYSIFSFFDVNKRYGIDKNGFFILEIETKNDENVAYVMFRSNNFIQKRVSQETIKFTDKETGKHYFSTHEIKPFYSEVKSDILEFSLEFETVKVADYYKFMIEPLKILTKASIASGNPIHWT